MGVGKRFTGRLTARASGQVGQIIAFGGDGLDDVLRPSRQIVGQAVIHPLTLALVTEQTLRAQQGQMA